MIFISLLMIKPLISQNDTLITWELCGLEGISISDVQTIENDFILASGDSSIFRSTDEGLTWTKIDSGFSNNLQFSESINDTIMAYTRRSDSILCSFDNGLNWRAINLHDVYGACMYVKRGILFVGIHTRVIASSDGGDSWMTLVTHSEINYIPAWSGAYPFYSIRMDDKNNLYISATGDAEHGEVNQSGIFRSEDNGETWYEISDSLANSVWNDILIDINGYIFVAGETQTSYNISGLYRTKDDGNSWEEILSCRKAWWILKGINNYIIAVTSCGIFISKDDGDTWNNITANLDGKSYGHVTTTSSGYIFAATEEGIYRFDMNKYVTSLSEQEKHNTIQHYHFSQNYPNPFNPSTTIEYDLPKSSDVNIEIYNIAGEKIQTLLNEKILAGSHQVEFNAENLSSGVYFYKIVAGEFQDVKKMILLK